MSLRIIDLFILLLHFCFLKLLQPTSDGPFQILKRVNDNAYKLDLTSTYDNVSATFSDVNLSLFDVGDSRTNPFEKGGNGGD